MDLYKITVNMAVHAGTYYVAADGFDEAVRMVQAAERKGGGHNGGVDKIEVVGVVGEDETNLLVSYEALRLLSR